MRNLLITGATGQIGKTFLIRNRHLFNRVVAVSRNPAINPDFLRSLDVEIIISHDLTLLDSLQFRDFCCLIHLADQNPDQNRSAMISNHLAELAKVNQFSEFIYISSMKIYGEFSELPLSTESLANPQSNYAKCKLFNEKILSSKLSRSPTRLVTIRSPNVIGPKCTGFSRVMMQFICNGLPIPINNQKCLKSLIPVEVLCDFIAETIFNEQLSTQPNQTFLASFDKYTATHIELLETLSRVLKSNARIFRVSTSLNLAIKQIPKYGVKLQSLYMPFYGHQPLPEPSKLVTRSEESLVSFVESAATYFIRDQGY